MGDSRGVEPLLDNGKGNSADASNRKMIVYIWDMDETLILLKSLLNGSYAEAFNGLKDVQKGIDIGKMWEQYILDVCDGYFFYEQIESYNQPVVNAFSQYDDGRDLSDYDFSKDGINSPEDDLNKRKLAYRHRMIAEKYKQGLHSLLEQKTVELWNELYDMTDRYTDGWLSSASFQKPITVLLCLLAVLMQTRINVTFNISCLLDTARTLLQHCSGHKEIPAHLSAGDGTEVQCINILVTSGSLIPSLVKCLLFRLDSLMTCENVYSSWDVGKLRCFSWIKERFNGPNVQFCVIGDGWEECEAAEILRWPFVKIDPKPDGFHRFPGLTLSTVGHYLSVVYERPHDEREGGDKVTTSAVV